MNTSEKEIDSLYRGVFEDNTTYKISNVSRDNRISISFTGGKITSNSSLQILTDTADFFDINISFENCDFEFQNTKKILNGFKNIRFSHCKFDNLIIENSKINNLHLYNCIGNLLEIGAENIETLNFINVFFREINFYSEHLTSLHNHLNIYYFSKIDDSFKEKLLQFINRNKIVDIGLDSSIKIVNFQIYSNYGIAKENDFFNNFKLNLNFDNRLIAEDVTGSYRIFNMPNIDSIILNGHFNDLNIHNVGLHLLSLSNFSTNLSNFDNIKVLDTKDSLFNLSEANLENCRFWNIDFTAFKYFNINKSIIYKGLFYLTSTPNAISSNEDYSKLRNEGNPAFINDYQYEFYKQFYSAFSQSNDFKNAMISRSRQTKYLYNSKLWGKNFESKFILFLSKWSNNFGIDWRRALYWIFGFPLILYIVYLYSLGYNFYWNLSKIDWNLVGNYFQFINPAHSMDFIKDKKDLSGPAIIIDFLTRIITGFGIYQFITAFRRYGKS